MLGVRLYMAQRISAMVMAPLVLVHLILIVYAVQGGLTAAEILARTKGSLAWALFYGLFVIAASVHAAIGLRVVMHEWAGMDGAALGAVTIATGVALLLPGLYAVLAVVW